MHATAVGDGRHGHGTIPPLQVWTSQADRKMPLPERYPCLNQEPEDACNANATRARSNEMELSGSSEWRSLWKCGRREWVERNLHERSAVS